MHTGQSANGFSWHDFFPRLMTDPYPPRVLGRESGDTFKTMGVSMTGHSGQHPLAPVARKGHPLQFQWE